jgi:uncharacterized DUF497 family protein
MDLSRFTGFDWDAGNESKNQAKHQVGKFEAEEVFFNAPLLVSADEKHSGEEPRSFVLGVTNGKRRLMVVFTSRGDRIRVISARDMSRKEREAYESHS